MLQYGRLTGVRQTDKLLFATDLFSTKAAERTNHLEHLFVEQGSHGVRHDVILERAGCHHHAALSQLLGQFPQGTTPTVDLKGKQKRFVCGAMCIEIKEAM